ncbi:MAG: right-handed parallel beta-helix repeat-containing protein [Planctomycetota bacterium]
MTRATLVAGPWWFAAALLILCAGDAAARTIRVPADHDTIQAAVDVAEYGDVVLVKSGTWNEDVRITTSGIRLLGQPGAILDGRNVPLTIENCVGVSVEGLKIVDSRADGVWIRGCSGITLLGCRVLDTQRSGVRAEGSADIVVKKCRFDDIGDAGVLLVEDAGGVSTRQCIVERCRFDGVNDDAIVTTGNDHELIRNRIGAVRGIGIHLFGGEGHLVEKNVVNGVGGVGILVRSANCRLIRNRVTKPGSDGIQVDTTGNFLEKNRIRRAGDDGFELNAGGNELASNRAAKSVELDLNVTISPDTNVYTGKNRFRKK